MVHTESKLYVGMEFDATVVVLAFWFQMHVIYVFIYVGMCVREIFSCMLIQRWRDDNVELV